jgi:hypothetical protein
VKEQVQLNHELQMLNRNLTTIVTFLNHSNVDSMMNHPSSYEMISSYLTQQITINRNLLLKSLEMMYIQRVDNWDCLFYDTFPSSRNRVRDYTANNDTQTDADTTSTQNGSRATMIQRNSNIATNYTVERVIPTMTSNGMDPGTYTTYMEYINQRLLSDLCLNETDFQYFFEARVAKKRMGNDTEHNVVPIEEEFVASVYSYTNHALMYYFPSDRNTIVHDIDMTKSPTSVSDNVTDATTTMLQTQSVEDTWNKESGLNPIDWMDANYCQNLPKTKRYMYQSL